MISLVTRDLYTLPRALLPPFKAHEQIDHCDDDELIIDKLAMVIERFEIKNGIVVFGSSYGWTPAEYSNGRTEVPRPPVSTFTAQAGDPPVDVSGDYAIESEGWGGAVSKQWLIGNYAAGLALTMTAGFAPETLPPGIRDLVLRGAAHLYEYREIYTGRNVEIQASWIDDWIAGYWQVYC